MKTARILLTALALGALVVSEVSVRRARHGGAA